jgi:hypothetical protein
LDAGFWTLHGTGNIDLRHRASGNQYLYALIGKFDKYQQTHRFEAKIRKFA